MNVLENIAAIPTMSYYWVFFLIVVEGKEEMNNLLDALMDSLSKYTVTVD